MRKTTTVFYFSCLGCEERVEKETKLQEVTDSAHLCQRCDKMKPKDFIMMRVFKEIAHETLRG